MGPGFIEMKYAYLLGTLPLLVLWIILFLHRKDLQKPMMVMSFIVGTLSVITAYLWWTTDWWRPLTITGTLIGIEDFLIGFASGGIMAAAYEEVFKKRLYRRQPHHHCVGIFTILLMSLSATAFLIWVSGITSFFASSIAMILAALLMFHYRRDLLLNGILTGFLMVCASLLFYVPIMLLFPEWIQQTYLFDHLSKILIGGIPLEEFVFWFLAGLVCGPFYEYWQGERFRKSRTTKRT